MDSIFGNSWSLPAHPQFQSNCEQELFTLMKEIDARVNELASEWDSRLSEMQKQLEKKQQEVEMMRNELRTCRSEMDKLQKSCAKRTSKNDKELTQENIEELREKAARLQEEVERLKSIVEIKEQQQKHSEASHQRLISIISDLQSSVEANSIQRSSGPGEPIPVHKNIRTAQNLEVGHLLSNDNDWQKLLDRAVFDFLAQEEIHKERLQAKIIEEIENTKLKLSDIKLSGEIGELNFKVS